MKHIPPSFLIRLSHRYATINLRRLLGTTQRPSHLPIDHMFHIPYIGKPILDSLSCPSALHSWCGLKLTNGIRCFFLASGWQCSNPLGSKWCISFKIQSLINSQICRSVITHCLTYHVRWVPVLYAIASFIRRGPQCLVGVFAISSSKSCLFSDSGRFWVVTPLPSRPMLFRRRVTIAELANMLRSCDGQDCVTYNIMIPCSASKSLLIVCLLVILWQ